MLINCSLTCVLKNKGIPQYLAGFSSVALTMLTAGGSVTLQMPLEKAGAEPEGKFPPHFHFGLHSKSCPLLTKLEPGQRQNEGFKENSEESPRLTWIHRWELLESFVTIRSSSIEFLTGSEPHMWIAWSLSLKNFTSWLVCVWGRVYCM